MAGGSGCGSKLPTGPGRRRFLAGGAPGVGLSGVGRGGVFVPAAGGGERAGWLVLAAAQGARLTPRSI